MWLHIPGPGKRGAWRGNKVVSRPKPGVPAPTVELDWMAELGDRSSGGSGPVSLCAGATMGDRHKLGPAVLLLRQEACPQRLRVPAWATRSPKAVCVEKVPLSLWPVTAALGATGFRGYPTLVSYVRPGTAAPTAQARAVVVTKPDSD